LKCGRQFSARHDSVFAGFHTDEQTIYRVLKALAEGNASELARESLILIKTPWRSSLSKPPHIAVARAGGDNVLSTVEPVCGPSILAILERFVDDNQTEAASSQPLSQWHH